MRQCKHGWCQQLLMAEIDHHEPMHQKLADGRISSSMHIHHDMCLRVYIIYTIDDLKFRVHTHTKEVHHAHQSTIHNRMQDICVKSGCIHVSYERSTHTPCTCTYTPVDRVHTNPSLCVLNLKRAHIYYLLCVHIVCTIMVFT